MIRKRILKQKLKEALRESGIVLTKIASVSVNRNPNNHSILWITIEADGKSDDFNISTEEI